MVVDDGGSPTIRRSASEPVRDEGSDEPADPTT